MEDIEYRNALAEVADILQHLKEEDRKKVPNKFIEFLEENKSKTYNVNLDYSKEISNMDLGEQTKALLSYMYIQYWANEEEKKVFIKKAKENDVKFEQEQREKYDIDKLFTSRRNTTNIRTENIETQNLPVQVKNKNFIKIIIDKIKKIFNKNRG